MADKRRFAFDWGGSLENNESLRQIARDLFQGGYEVYVVPAVGSALSFPYQQALASIGVPYTALWLVIHDAAHSPEAPGGPEWIAFEKVRAMRELGCSVLYDDNPTNIATVKAAGMEGVLVSRCETVARPPELTNG